MKTPDSSWAPSYNYTHPLSPRSWPAFGVWRKNRKMIQKFKIRSHALYLLDYKLTFEHFLCFLKSQKTASSVLIRSALYYSSICAVTSRRERIPDLPRPAERQLTAEYRQEKWWAVVQLVTVLSCAKARLFVARTSYLHTMHIYCAVPTM